ncbi:glycoside hydrolase [Alteromonadaceae bacterium M269]|nr:glycoside hydrolase [Alteromonadaceae bacterium M269]
MNYQKLIDQVKVDEGLRLKPYKCSEGWLNIGYGRNLETSGISEKEAEEMLLSDLENCESQLLKEGLIGRQHNGARNAVLINMCFQIGFQGLLKFKKTLNYLLLSDYENASTEMLDSKWAKQTPNRARELSEQM